MNDEIEKLRAHVRLLNVELQKQYGTIAALEGAIHALMLSHPSPSVLQREVAAGLEIAESVLLGGSKSEAGLAAFQEARKRIDDSSQMSHVRQSPGK